MGGRSRWIVVVIGVGGLALLLLFGSRILSASWADTANEEPAGPTRELVELWGTYQRAQLVVKSAEPDAQLVSAMSQWQSPDGETLRSGRGEWTFVFYDSADKNVLDVVVSEGTGRIVDRSRVWEAPEILAEDIVWRGPRDAIAVFLAYGGDEFVAEHPEAIVSAHLGVGDAGRPVWTVSAINVADRDVLSVATDAETNRVLSTSP
jgi:hypothetical protein